MCRCVGVCVCVCVCVCGGGGVCSVLTVSKAITFFRLSFQSFDLSGL